MSVLPRRQRLRYEIVGLGLFTLGLLLMLGPGSGLVGRSLQYVLAFLLGAVGAKAISVALMGLGAAMVVRWERVDFGRMAISFGILLWIFLSIWQLCAPDSARMGLGFAAEPGGVLGFLVAAWVRPLFGRVFGMLVLALCAVCTVAYLTDTPLISILTATGRGLRFSSAAAASALGQVRIRRRPPRVRAVRRRPRLVREEPVGPSPAHPAPVPPVEPAPARKEAPEQPHLALLKEEEDGDGSASAKAAPSASRAKFELPPLSLLSKPPQSGDGERDALSSVETLETALSSYGIEGRVVDVERGPRVTRYELHLPPGVRVSRVTNLADDLAYALSALSVRVEAPVPGKGVIGIEVPNPEVTFVHLREVLESQAAARTKSRIAFALGRGISGHPMMADLATMPHLLIAGATNSGKSVCLNSLIATILFRARPDEVKMLLIDPKRVELSLFEGIPHLAAPVAHDAREAAGLLRWAIREMELRYSQFADLGVRNILGWNERAAIDDELEPFYYLLIVIDELADLMMQAATEFETSICRLAQLARATGIHLVVATQRPSVNVITGTIKANIASRIAFAVASQVDSRTILDVNGAERLVGSGDMLYLPLDAPTGKPVRIQGAYIGERDIAAVVNFWKQQARPEYARAAMESIGSTQLDTSKEGGDADDSMFEKTLEFVLATKHASASMLQRKFKLGYTRAARLIDMMEERGYVGPHDGRRPREVFGAPGRPLGGDARDDSADTRGPASDDLSDDFDGEEDEPEEFEDQ